MASNFSMIPICWLLTVDSEMAYFLFDSLAEGVLVTWNAEGIPRLKTGLVSFLCW